MVVGRRCRLGLSVLAVTSLALAGLSWTPATAAGSGSQPRPLGKARPLPGHVRKPGHFAQFTSPPAAAERALAAAAGRAAASGRAVTARSLTTGTTTITASPRGIFTGRSYVLPVRVRRGRGWVPVNTRLRFSPGGRLSPVAIPGDSVSFSPGGKGPMAVIATGSAYLALWWPGVLPTPVVRGPSATYRNVLPGVSLVLTATSEATGGYREVLVVSSAKAAAALSSVRLRVTSHGTRLSTTMAGGLVAPISFGRGYFVAPPPVMWDTPGPTAAQPARQRAGQARQVGAGLAPPWSPPVSGAWGPGRDAMVAPVAARVSVAGSVLRLIPDSRLLASPAVRYPLYVDPSLVLQHPNGFEQAYDPVQSGSGCTGSHYNWSSYADSPVGYDNFQNGTCQYQDTDRALYRVRLPQAVGDPGIHLVSAVVNAKVAYSSSCSVTSTDTLSWINGITSDTGWPGPGRTHSDTDVTANFPPDTSANNGTSANSCDGTVVKNDGATVPNGFNVFSDISHADGSSFTFRIWQPGASDDTYHEQFTNNPYLAVQFFYSPNTPSTSGMQASSTSTGSNAKACATTTASAPTLQVSSSTQGAWVRAALTDPDGQSVLDGNIHYWQNSNPSNGNSTSTGNPNYPSSGAWFNIPWSFMSGFGNGTLIAYQAQAETGTNTVAGKKYGPYTSGWSNTCYFRVDPNAIAGPTVTTKNFTQGTAQPVGNTVSFTITQTSGYTAKYFVWGLDNAAPAGTQPWTPPSSQSCSTSSAATPNCVISSGQATLNIVVPSPGPHILNVYQINSDNTTSETSQDLYAGSNYTFTGASDTNVQYTSQSTLAANFATALTAGKPYDNTMISKNDETYCGAGGGDGNGDYYDAKELASAGWTAGQHITVDGASFALPSFGSCGADNVLAANQTLGAGGARGNALVFLAVSTNGDVGVPGLMTASPDSGPLQSDYTAPAVPGGSLVSGSGCVEAANFGSPCVPATGQINYAAAAGCPATQSTYTLTSPSWITGPAGIEALAISDRVEPGGKRSDTPKIYAFAVPVYGSCQVTSVTLPDVGPSVLVAPGGGVSLVLPALHIFGVALRNTTTATPLVSGSGQASPSGQAWTGAFESPIEDDYTSPPGYTWGNQTMRTAVSPNISAPAGARVRIRLSFPGFLAGNLGPLQIGAASIANAYAGAIPAQTPLALTFGGSSSVTVPGGGDVYSDPLTLPFAVTAGHALLVSFWLKNAAPGYLPLNSWGAGALTWLAASASPYAPNETMDTTGTPFTATGSTWIGAVVLLTGVDITTGSAVLNGPNGSATSPGAPTVVVAGDNVTDGYSSSPLGDSLNAPSGRLAGQLASQGVMPGYGVVDAGVGSNQLLSDASPGGESLVARLDRDILAEPDAGTVVIDEGLQDLLLSSADRARCVDSSSSCALVDGYTALAGQLNAFGINVIVANMTPCGGYSNLTANDSCTGSESPPTDPSRLWINDQIMGGQLGVVPYCGADLDSAVTAGPPPPGSPEDLQPADATKDKVNLSWAGYAALAPAVPADVACLGPGNDPVPPPP